MATKIPQDVTREDRLIGPLTLRQFLVVLLGSGIIFVAYEAYANYYIYFSVFILIAFIIGLFSAALAFGTVNGRSFPIFLGNLWHSITTPKRWEWAKEDRETVAPLTVAAPDIKDTRTEAQERKSGKVIKMQIEQLASVLDTGGTINQEQDTIVASQTGVLPPSNPRIRLDITNVEDVLADSD